jgi:hypothetical protein
MAENVMAEQIALKRLELLRVLERREHGRVMTVASTGYISPFHIPQFFFSSELAQCMC